MARRGRFGRARQQGNSLAALIVSIAREIAAARQRNIMDAWESGGTFEGKPVTDDMVLDFWKQQMSGVDPKDPTYDEYKLNYDQLDFGINEAKQRLLYDQGKISAGRMAQFYLNWAKKIPRNSQFWRTLQTRAAQFMQAAVSRGRAGRAAGEKKAYDDAQAATARATEPGRIVEEVLRNVAIVNGLVDARDTKGLANLSDPARMQELLDGINANPDEVIYIQDGVAVTGRMVFDRLKQADPNFKDPFAGGTTPPAGRNRPTGSTPGGGGLSTDYIVGALQGAHSANIAMADRAAANGKKEDTNRYRKAAGEVAEFARDARLWGVSPSYAMIIQNRDHVLNDPGASVQEKLNALNVASSALLGLARSPGLDARSIITLTNEANANAGHEEGNKSSTFGEDYLGIKTPSGVFDPSQAEGEEGRPGANQRMATLWQQFNGEVTFLKTYPDNFTLTFGTRDPDTGEFKFDPDGTEIGVVPQEEVARNAVEYTTMVVEQAGGPPQLVTVVGREVRAYARNADGVKIPTARPAVDADGQQLYNESGDPLMVPVDDYLATEFQLTQGGKTTRFYRMPDGTVTLVPPWAANATELDNNDGTISVDVSALVPPDATAYIPQDVAINAMRRSGIPNPEIDYASMIAASVAASDDPRALASAVIRTPEIMSLLRTQQATAAGVVLDETGSVIEGDAGRFYRIQDRETSAILSVAGVQTPSSAAHYSTFDPQVGYRQTLADRASAKVEMERSNAAFYAQETSRRKAMGLPTITPISEIKLPTYQPVAPAVPTPLGVSAPPYVPPAAPVQRYQSQASYVAPAITPNVNASTGFDLNDVSPVVAPVKPPPMPSPKARVAEFG